jgi:drug/metabolite transporter, DME family
MSPDRSGWTGSLIVVAAAGLFATLGVLSRTAYAAGVEPFAFVTWRATVGAIGLWAAIGLLRSRGRPLRWRSLGPGARRGLLLAVIVATALNLSIFVALQRTTVALALLGFYTYPALVAGASVALGREPLDRARLVALVLAMAGMAAVVLGGLGGPGAGSELRLDLIGLGAALTAAGCQTVFVLLSRDYADVPTDQAMGTILAGTAVIAAVVTLVTGGPAALAAPFATVQLCALLIAVGLFAAALPSFLFLTGIRRIGGVRTGILMLAEQVVGVALAAILLSEAVTPLQVLGGGTILVAGLLVQREASEPGVVRAVAPVPGGP